MSLLSPTFLWTFLALIPLAAIYFLKVRPRKKVTTAYFLWEQIFSEKKATSLFNRLRDILSLILLALAVSALVFALARPEFAGDERKDLLILIDQSASMSAREGGKTRFELAQDTAREIVIALNGDQRAAVALVARDIKFESHLSESPRELIDAIEAGTETDYPFDSTSLKTLGEDAHWSDDHRVLLLSDGAFLGEDAGALPKNIELIKIGQPADNLGIVAADLQRLPDGRLGFYFRVASTYEDPVKTDLVLTHQSSGRIGRLIPLDVVPGENESEVFYLDEGEAGVWTAEIETEDALTKDNVAWLSVPEKRPVRVEVATEDRYFFETSVLAFQRGSGLLTLVDEAPEITIEKGNVTNEETNLSMIFAPSGAESSWWKIIGEEVDAIAPRVLLPEHPVLRNLDMSAVSFVGAKEIEPIDGALVLVESETGVPLVYRASREGKTALIVNLDPVASEFYFSAWFPVLVHGAATHLAGREESLASVYRPGESVPVPGFREGSEASVVLPDKTETPITSGRFGPLQTLGAYEIRSANGDASPLTASLVSPMESLIRNPSVESNAKPVSRGQSPSYWLIVLAIFILVAESILYHLRKVG